MLREIFVFDNTHLNNTIMKKLFFFAFLLSMTGMQLLAAPRERSKLEQIASRKLATVMKKSQVKDNTIPQKVKPDVDADVMPPQVEVVDSSAAYYIFNADNSFILVSTDDRLPEVLGYGLDGQLRPDDMPPAMKYLLEEYDEELAYLDRIGYGETETDGISFNDEKEFLIQTQWNQGVPYWNKTPLSSNSKQCYTGCVATAMAQLMYYYKYPTKGTGSHTYKWEKTKGDSVPLTADFGNTIYDWDNMRLKYTTGEYNDVEANAVATLMSHCGVAVEMDYGDGSSGALSTDVPKALETYFGYDKNYEAYDKVLYTADSICRIVHDEIAAGRPVFVSGGKKDGSGHAFLCDGYRQDGTFHINWGWGGYQDNYFLLTVLNPDAGGIGGSSAEGGYNHRTKFFLGLQPQSETSHPHRQQVAIDSIRLSKDRYGRKEQITVYNDTMRNYGGMRPINIIGAIAIATEEGKIIDYYDTSLININLGYYKARYPYHFDLDDPFFSSGTYRLFTVYKDGYYTDWAKMPCLDMEYYRTIYVTRDSIYVVPNHEAPKMTLNMTLIPESDKKNWHEDEGEVYIDRLKAHLKVSITNTGGTFKGTIVAQIYDGDTYLCDYASTSVKLQRGDSQTITFPETMPETLIINKKYTLRLGYKADTSEQVQAFDEPSGKIVFRISGYNRDMTDKICYGTTVYNKNDFYIDANTDPEIPTYEKTGDQFFRCVKLGDRDSVVRLILMVNERPKKDISATLCSGDTFFFHGDTFYKPNVNRFEKFTFDTSISVPQLNACDSFYDIHLTYLPLNDSTITVAVCHGETYPFHGRDYDPNFNGGRYDTIIAGIGEDCDTVYHLHITEMPEESATIDALLCDATPYVFRDLTFTTPSPENEPYLVRIEQEGGCDSVYYINLRQGFTAEAHLHVSVCTGETFRFGNIDYAASDEPIRVPVPQPDACDSVYYLHIAERRPDTTHIPVHISSETSMPHVVDDFLTLLQMPIGDTTIVVNIRPTECLFNAYDIRPDNASSAIHSTLKAWNRCDITDILGRHLGTHQLPNPSSLTPSSYGIERILKEALGLTDGIYILRLHFTDGSTTTTKMDIR